MDLAVGNPESWPLLTPWRWFRAHRFPRQPRPARETRILAENSPFSGADMSRARLVRVHRKPLVCPNWWKTLSSRRRELSGEKSGDPQQGNLWLLFAESPSLHRSWSSFVVSAATRSPQFYLVESFGGRSSGACAEQRISLQIPELRDYAPVGKATSGRRSVFHRPELGRTNG